MFKRFATFLTESQPPDSWRSGWMYPWVIGGGGKEEPYLKNGKWVLYVWNAKEKKHYLYDFASDTFDLQEDGAGGAGGGVGGGGSIANAAGTGNIAGLGVGKAGKPANWGEPGVNLRKKKITEDAEAKILYQKGDFWVKAETFGKTKGYGVYKDGLTHATRVSQIGYPGDDGLARAKKEVDRRAGIKEDNAVVEYTPVKNLADAEGLWCEQCEKMWVKYENPAWGLNKTKGLHERGTGHKPIYVKFASRLKEHRIAIWEGARPTVKLTVTARDYDAKLEKLINFIKTNGNTGHSFSIDVDGKKFDWDGDGGDSIVDVTSQVLEAVQADADVIEKAAQAVHDQWMAKQVADGHTEHISPDGDEDYMQDYDELSHEAKELDRGAAKAVLQVLNTVKEETFAGAEVFEVDSDRFASIKGPKHPRHRYARYVGADELGETIRSHGRKKKGDIVLKDSKTAVMTYLRRKPVRG